MRLFKRAFDFYLQASIHVAVACAVLVKMTQHMFHIHDQNHAAFFAFFGTVTAYNFVKYDALARTNELRVSANIKAIATLSFLTFLGAAYMFWQLQSLTKLVSAVFLGLTLLYTLPFFPNKRNARNWAGVKIYIVSLCWVGVTVILPMLDAGIGFTTDFYIKCLQRFLLIFVLVLIFEIIDLKKDDPHLHTVPQQLGVKRTKILGVLLMLIFYGLEFLKMNVDEPQLIINIVLVMLTSGFLFFANEKRSKYYTSFWAESIPILWWLLICAI